jgi:hypothetical protein
LLRWHAAALEEHHELELEEDHGVDGGATALGVQLSRPVAHEAQVELGFQVAVEVIPGNEVLQRDGDGLVEAAGFGRAEHENTSRREPSDTGHTDAEHWHCKHSPPIHDYLSEGPRAEPRER